jgi:hypothetical protein
MYCVADAHLSTVDCNFNFAIHPITTDELEGQPKAYLCLGHSVDRSIHVCLVSLHNALSA